jgi:pseudouridine synthase
LAKMERLHKVMARYGVASRRASEKLITEGRVSVNGEVVIDLGCMVDPEEDIIRVDGILLKPVTKRLYIILNKPPGYITTLSDTHGRATVFDLLKGIEERIHPVGRLDMDTSGLLLLTNHGELTFRLTHPKFQVDKGYEAIVKGVPKPSDIERLAHGVLLEDGITSPAKVKLLKANGDGLLSIIIHEGRKRQVRRMCEAIGYPVIALKRVSMGSINLGSLKEGEHRNLREEEVTCLLRLVGLESTRVKERDVLNGDSNRRRSRRPYGSRKGSRVRRTGNSHRKD